MHKVLIVDDIETNRRSIKLTLSDLEEIRYLEADNGKDGIAIARRERPDLIFMDIMMPEMDGLAVIRALRSDPETADGTILAITALGDDRVKTQALHAGADDFINKPFDDQELTVRTRNYLGLAKMKALKLSGTKPVRKRPGITLYDDPTLQNVRIVFHIAESGDLTDFWNFLEKEPRYDWACLNDAATLIITVAGVLFKAGKVAPFDIVLESGDDAFYLSIWNKTFVKATLKYFEKFTGKHIPFKHDEEKLTVKAPQVAEVAVSPAPAVPSPTPKTDAPAAPPAPAAREKVVFDFMEEEDLEEIKVLIGELKSDLLLFGSSTLEPDDVATIQAKLENIGKITKLYNETYRIAEALENLSASMRENQQGYIDNSQSVAELFVAFGNDLELWLGSLFITGTTDLHFLDDTIVSNTETIIGFATGGGDGGEEELDDIFDF